MTREFTITYKASTDNQLLTIRWEKNSGASWISLEAAAMTGSLSLPFVEDFSGTSAAGWMPTNESLSNSDWNTSNGEYRQDNFVGFNGNALQGAYHVGTYSYLTSAMSLTDHSVSVMATQEGSGGWDFGLMTRVDATNDSYQRVSFSAANGFTRIESKQNGVWTTLGRNARGIAPGDTVTLSMQSQGANSIAYVDGQKLSGIYNPALTSGSVGLYCRDACAFDDLVIDELTTVPTVAIASPMEYNIMGSSTFNVSAVAINLPAGGGVNFEVNGLTNACTAATQMDTGYFTATCTVPGQSSYELTAELLDNGNTVIDSHMIAGLGVGFDYTVVGDSIVNGLDDNTRGDGSSPDGYLLNGQGFEPIAVSYLNDLPAFEPTMLHNEGVPGDTTTRILTQRLAGLFERHANATNMVLMIGVNDAGGASFTPSGLNCVGVACDGTFKGNMQDIINQANAQGITPLIPLTMPRFGDAGDGVPPYIDPANNSRNLLIRDEYNQVITSQLSGRIVGPDLYNLYLGQENRFYLYNTNLHPNALGYHVLATEIFNAITAQSMEAFYVDNICMKLTVGGNCETVVNIKQNLVEPGTRLWPDENFVLNAPIPAVLDGGRWLLPTNNERNLTNSNYLTFDVPSSSKVYVAYDADSALRPAWLTSGYTDTGINISTSNPLAANMRLFESNSSVTGTHTVPAAAAANNGAQSNYLIIVVEDAI